MQGSKANREMEKDTYTYTHEEKTLTKRICALVRAKDWEIRIESVWRETRDGWGHDLPVKTDRCCHPPIASLPLPFCCHCVLCL